MMKKEYTELEVWKVARILTKEIYQLVATFPKEEVFGLSNQLKRCAVSVPSNIAEGCGRSHLKETLHFLFIARGSAYEMETQLYLSYDLNYIEMDNLTKMLTKIKTFKKILNGFINYYKHMTAVS